MKLLNPNLRCGGKNGCGMEVQFRDGETVEDAHAVFLAHRTDPNHPKMVDRNQLAQGWSP